MAAVDHVLIHVLMCTSFISSYQSRTTIRSLVCVIYSSDSEDVGSEGF